MLNFFPRIAKMPVKKNLSADAVIHNIGMLVNPVFQDLPRAACARSRMRDCDKKWRRLLAGEECELPSFVDAKKTRKRSTLAVQRLSRVWWNAIRTACSRARVRTTFSAGRGESYAEIARSRRDNDHRGATRAADEDGLWGLRRKDPRLHDARRHHH